MTDRALPPDRHAHPRLLIEGAVARFGRDAVVRWCEELLAGRATTDDRGFPPIEWLGGTDEWPEYWARVWGARGLLHLGPPARPAVVFGSLDDPAWRVREMALKVVRRYGLDDPQGQVEALLEDPVERVRAQARRVLESEQASAVSPPRRDAGGIRRSRPGPIVRW